MLYKIRAGQPSAGHDRNHVSHGHVQWRRVGVEQDVVGSQEGREGDAVTSHYVPYSCQITNTIRNNHF